MISLPSITLPLSLKYHVKFDFDFPHWVILKNFHHSNVNCDLKSVHESKIMYVYTYST